MTEEDARKNIGLAFVPSVEAKIKASGDSFDEYDQPFLTEDPAKLLKEGRFHKVPLMLGFNTHEAMLFVRRELSDLLNYLYNFLRHLSFHQD